MNAINTVQRAIDTKSVLPILDCIKLESIDSSHVLVSGTNVNIYIEYNLECMVSVGGAIALESRMFGDIIRKMPDGLVSIEVSDSNDVTKIECGKSRFSIRGQDPSGFPNIPELQKSFSFNFSEPQLKKIIRRVLPFISMNEGRRPVLTGALFDIKGANLTVVTTDSHRVSAVKEELAETLPDTKIVVPGQTLRELLKLLRDEGKITLTVCHRKMLFEFEHFKLITSLLDGEFLRYEAIIAAVNPIAMRIDKRVLAQSLERAILLINDDMSSASDNRVPVKLNIRYDSLFISCMTGKGQVNDDMKAEVEGGELEIGFNCRFLLDALAVCDDDEILMEFSTATSGCFIKPTGQDNSYVYMILPVRLYN